MTLRTNSGPRERWVPISEYEVGRPHFRPTRNPVMPAQTPGSASPVQSFPYNAISQNTGQSLELVTWTLYDTFMALVNTKMIVQTLFAIGQGQPFTPLGGTSAVNKNYLYSDITTFNGLLPPPQSFLVRYIRQRVRSDIFLQDLLNWMFSTLGTLQCGDLQRQYFLAPMADIPTAQGTPYVTVPGSVYSKSIAGVGWPTVHSRYDMRTELNDPNLGGVPDIGVVINQGRQFYFQLDPTQDIVNYPTGWSTTAGSTSGGTGIFAQLILEGVLARSLSG